MRGMIWTAVLWSLCGASLAVAQEKTEAAPTAEVAPQAQPSAAEEKPTEAKPADEPTADEPAAPSAQKTEQPAPPTEAAKAAEPASPSAPEPARAEMTEAEKAPAAKAAAQGPFQASWQQASPDVPRSFRREQQARPGALGQGDPRGAQEDPEGASAARRAPDETPLGFRDP